MDTWFSDAKPLSSLEAEVCFLLNEDFYYGPDRYPDVSEGKFVDKLTLPDIPRQVASQVRVSEAVGHERQLAAYYTRVVQAASKRHTNFQSIRSYFWLRFWLWNSQEGTYVSFPWHDTFSEIDRFLHALLTVEEGEVYYDIDQGWEMEIQAHNGSLYLRQRDPDAEETHLVVSVPRTSLLPQIGPLRERTQSVISFLSQAVGADVWTPASYSEEPSFRIARPWWKKW